MHEDSKQRVWVELETPRIVRKGESYRNSDKENPTNVVTSPEEAKTLMERRAKLASNMLRRLGVDGEDRFFVMDDKGYPRYAQSLGGGMFSVMSEGGAWMNLGYLGREL